MRRTFAVIGFTVFVTAYALCTFGFRAAQIALPVLALSTVLCMAVCRLRREPVLVCSLLSATAACLLFLTAMATSYLPVRDMKGTTPVITAHVCDLPRRIGGSTVVTLQTDAVGGEPMRQKILLYSEELPEIALTDTLTFSAKLYVSDDPTDDAWLRIYDMTDLTVTPGKATMRSRMLSVRRYIKDTFAKTMPGTTGAVLTAMLLGDRDAIPDDIYAAMTRSGILHIFSVSGLHLSVIALALLRVFDRRRLPRGVCELLCAGLVLFVMAVTGFPHSCVRAGLMLLLMLFGRMFARRADALNSLGFSLLLMCGVDPFCAGDVGLQLSVLGTLGVVCAAPYIERLVSKIRLPFYPVRTAVQSILSTMLLSAIITVLTLPVAAVTFDSVSVVAPLTNACMLWAAAAALPLAVFALPFSLWAPFEPVFRTLMLAAGLLARYCTAAAQFFGDLPFAALRTGDPSFVHGIAGTMLLIAAAIVLRIPTRRKIILTAVLSVLFVGLLGIGHWALSQNTAEIEALDVGSGTAILVRNRGRTAMIGCSGDGALRAAKRETNRLDWLLLPRAVKAETANASAFVRGMAADAVYVPETSPFLHPVFFFGQPHVYAGQTLRVGDAEVSFLPQDVSSAALLRVYGRTVLILFSPVCDLSRLPRAWLSADVLVVRGDVPPAIQAENYVCVLVQSAQPHASQAARDIRAHGGEAVCNGTVTIQKGGYISERTG